MLADFPLSSVPPYVKRFAMLPLEPLHTLSLRICLWLQECEVSYLGDNSLEAGSVRTSQSALGAYRKIRKMVLRCLNLFLKNVGTSSPGSDLNVDFSKNGDYGGNGGIFFGERACHIDISIRL